MEFNTDSVMFLFLFILPGAFSKLLLHRFAPERYNEDGGKTVIMETSQVVVFSALVFAINLAIIWLCDNRLSATNIILNMRNEAFLLKYILLTFATTGIATYTIHSLNKTIVLKLVNGYNKFFNKPMELAYSTVWENLFESSALIDFANNPQVIAIEKGGDLLTCGFLTQIPAPNTKCNEVALSHTNAIRSYLARDEESDPNYRIFDAISYEYYNMEYDVVIKFYNMERYNAYQESVAINPSLPEEAALA